MATGQATEAAEAGSLGNDGNAARRHFFPAPKGLSCGGRPASRGLGASHPGLTPGRACWIVTPQLNANAKGMGNPG